MQDTRMINLPKKCEATTWFTYHEVVPAATGDAYSVDVSSFREHIAAIARLDRRAVVTFDDGHISQYQNAFPVLTEFGVKAIFFITAGWTGRRNGYMNWRDLRDLASAGHEIQSHGWSHAYLTRCPDGQLDQEIRNSRATLEDKLGAAVTAISAPGGRWDRRVADACRAAGVRVMYTSDPWQGPIETDHLTQIGRFMVRNHMGTRHLAGMMASRSRRLDLLRMEHQLKRVFRFVTGDRLYHALWRSVSHRDIPAEPTTSR